MTSSELISDYLLGIASDEDVQELESRLRQDEKLQDEFLIQAELDAYLRQETQGPASFEDVPTVSLEDSSFIWKCLSGVSMLAAAVLLMLFVFGSPGGKGAFAYPSLGSLSIDVQLSEQNIWAAAGRGDLSGLRQELKTTQTVDAKWNGVLSPLHFAALYNQVDAAELLIDEGATISLTDDKGNTALHIASFLGYEDVVRMLLVGGANPAMRNNLGFTSSDLVALEWNSSLEKYYRQLEKEMKTKFNLNQIQSARPKILRLLNEVNQASQDSAPTVGIWQAVVVGNLQAVKQHIATGTEINEAEDLGGSTPLMLAAIYGHTEIAKELINAGADLELQNKSGDTALFQACFFCRPGIVELLLDAGADPNRTNQRGLTPLDSVAHEFSEELHAIYQHVYDLVGLELDVEYVKTTRPRVSAIVRSAISSEKSKDN